MTSAAEAETSAMYVNYREAVPQRIALIKMGHTQPSILIYTNNLSSHSVVMDNIQSRMTKAIDMHLHRPRCQETQGQFR